MNKTNERNNKRQYVKSTSLATETRNTTTEMLTKILEACDSVQLIGFIDNYIKTDDFKNNHEQIPDCITNLKDNAYKPLNERKSLIKEVVEFLIENCTREQVSTMFNDDIGQMMFGWLFDGEEPKYNLSNERKKLLKGLQDNEELVNNSEIYKQPKANIKLDLGLDSKYKCERTPYVTPTEVLEVGREESNNGLQLNLKINRRMSDMDILNTIQFGDIEVNDRMIMAMEYANTKTDGKSKVSVPHEYLTIAENNSKLDNTKLRDYLEILVVDSIRKGRMVRDIIKENREVFEENLSNGMLSIYTPLFQTVKLEYNTFTIKDIDDRHIVVTLGRDYDSDFKFKFKFDLGLNRVCL